VVTSPGSRLGVGDGTLVRYGYQPVSSHKTTLTHNQICNFLRSMVSEIDLEAIKPVINGAEPKTELKTSFNPVGRRLQILSDLA